MAKQSEQLTTSLHSCTVMSKRKAHAEVLPLPAMATAIVTLKIGTSTSARKKAGATTFVLHTDDDHQVFASTVALEVKKLQVQYILA